MEDQVSLKIELDIAAQKILNHVIINNDAIERQIESGIKSAFANFDFEGTVKKACENAIEDNIKKSIAWGKLREIVQLKADKIVSDHIDKQMEILKDKL